MDVRYEVRTEEGRVRCYGHQEALEEIQRHPDLQAYDYATQRYVGLEELQERVQAEMDAEAAEEADQDASPSP